MYQKVIIIIILGSCKRYAGQEKGYIEVPCPFVVLNYNRSMGGVDFGESDSQGLPYQNQAQEVVLAVVHMVPERADGAGMAAVPGHSANPPPAGCGDAGGPGGVRGGV